MGEERDILERFETEFNDDNLPVVTTQLPVYNEANVVERLVRAVCAFDYPREKHEIQLLDDSVDESMVKAISEVGHAMGIETIAERVETKQVLDKLGALGIEFAQGYYIARPTSVRSFGPWSSNRLAELGT